jgi:hypothetical protein
MRGGLSHDEKFELQMPHLSKFCIAQRTSELGWTIKSAGTGHSLDLSVSTISDEFSVSD